MKKIGLGLLAFAANFVFLTNSNGQTTGKEIKKADINFTELANYYKEHPPKDVIHMPFDEDDEEEHRVNHAGDPTPVHMYHPTLKKGTGGTGSGAMLPVSIAPADSFLGSVSPGSYIPPDTHGAVDSQYVVNATNAAVQIQTRVGGSVSLIALDGFWTSVLPSGTGSFDPRVHYDPFYKRWILVADAVASTAMDNSTLLIAVSATSDPTGAWHQFAVPIDPTGAAWLDFPNVGFNQRWLVVTGNMFANTTGGATGAVVYVFNYANIMAGTGAPFVKFSQPSSFSLCPALVYDVTEPNMFMVESYSGNAGQLKLWKITGPVGAPVLSAIGLPSTTQHWHGSGSANFATQLGTTNKVDAGDDRFTSMIFKNKKLWCTHTVFLPSPGTATRSSIMWWQIDTLANPIQIGMINNSSPVTFFTNSSIAVNDSNDALIGFSYFNNTVYPSAGYALRLHTDPIDSTRPARIYRHGQATYYTTFGGPKNRWGDYSATCLDPRNFMDFWTVQEASNSGTSANWDTWWANVQICPKPAEPTMAYVGSPCVGDTASFIVNPIAGATSYSWFISGAGWTGTATGTTYHVTAGSGPATIVVVAYNACGEGESHTFVVNPSTVPPAPTISVYTPPCTGVTTATFTGTGAPNYIWQVVGTGWSGSSTTSTFNTTVGTSTAFIICHATNACGVGPSDTLTITPGTPVVSFTESTHVTYVGSNITINFTGSAPSGSTFAWYFGGGVGTPGTGAGIQTVHWTSVGTKTVTLVVDNNGCSGTFTDTVRVKPSVGVEPINNLELTVNIAPNPNDGSFNVEFTKPITGVVTVKIVDMEGRLVYNNEFKPTNNTKLPVTTNNLPAGTYAVSVYLDGEAVTKKITINR